MIEKWNKGQVQERLHRCFQNTPIMEQPELRSPTRIGADYIRFATDQSCLLEVSKIVLSAIMAPPPHPEFGDDGYRDGMRERALEALDWCEQWIRWRKEDNWGDRVCYFDSPKVNDTEISNMEVTNAV